MAEKYKRELVEKKVTTLGKALGKFSHMRPYCIEYYGWTRTTAEDTPLWLRSFRANTDMCEGKKAPTAAHTDTPTFSPITRRYSIETIHVDIEPLFQRNRGKDWWTRQSSRQSDRPDSNLYRVISFYDITANPNRHAQKRQFSLDTKNDTFFLKLKQFDFQITKILWSKDTSTSL